MTDLLICYDFKFNLDVKKRNGKTYKHHVIMGLGFNYQGALWDIYFKLKKRKTEILQVNEVTVCRIAFALWQGQSVLAALADHPPLIPQDLNNSLKYLPKKV